MRKRKVGRKTRRSTWMAVLLVAEPPPGLVMDDDVASAVLYSFAFHAQPRHVSFHGLSFVDDRVRLVFTASVAARDALLRSVTADVVGYVGARFGGPACRVDVEELVALGTAQEQLRALAQIAAEGGLSP